jgi:hypothetical protein
LTLLIILPCLLIAFYVDESNNVVALLLILYSRYTSLVNN